MIKISIFVIYYFHCFLETGDKVHHKAESTSGWEDWPGGMNSAGDPKMGGEEQRCGRKTSCSLGQLGSALIY